MPKGIPALARLFLSCVFTAHLVLAAAWWWLMPGGFALTHPRFWVNRIMPMVVIGIAGVYLAARFARRDDVLRLLGVWAAVFWAAAAVSGRIVFPITLSTLWIFPLLGAVAIGLAAARGLRSTRPISRWGLLTGAAVALVLGGLAPITQRGSDPHTRPLNVAVASHVAGDLSGSENLARLDDSLRVQPNGGVVYVKCGALHLDIEPLLTFISRSPDRCWTIFAPRRQRMGPPRRVTATQEKPDWVQIDYTDDGVSRLTVTRDESASAVAIEALSRLPQPIYSHLNSYCAIMIMGHRRLELAFSPCPDARIEVTSSDYPFGRPARFAYLDADEMFHIVEARSAEKGPFQRLAAGKLGRGEPLTIMLYDQGELVGGITLEDWSAQLSTALSPTAGWGVPENSITFVLTGRSPTSPAFISIELAGTGIGRGYDSVGHTPGTYRNRLRIEPREALQADSQQLPLNTPPASSD